MAGDHDPAGRSPPHGLIAFGAAAVGTLAFVLFARAAAQSVCGSGGAGSFTALLAPAVGVLLLLWLGFGIAGFALHRQWRGCLAGALVLLLGIGYAFLVVGASALMSAACP